jgi:1,4-alpha-glucan branching enzyme
MSTKTKSPSPRNNRARKTTLAITAPDAAAVFVAGTFNEWNPGALPMKRSTSGSWSVDLELTPGRYEYKFVVDGQWCCEPGCEDEHRGCAKCVPNDQGTMNRVLDVS